MSKRWIIVVETYDRGKVVESRNVGPYLSHEQANKDALVFGSNGCFTWVEGLIHPSDYEKEP